MPALPNRRPLQLQCLRQRHPPQVIPPRSDLPLSNLVEDSSVHLDLFSESVTDTAARIWKTVDVRPAVATSTGWALVHGSPLKFDPKFLKHQTSIPSALETRPLPALRVVRQRSSLTLPTVMDSSSAFRTGEIPIFSRHEAAAPLQQARLPPRKMAREPSYRGQVGHSHQMFYAVAASRPEAGSISASTKTPAMSMTRIRQNPRKMPMQPTKHPKHLGRAGSRTLVGVTTKNRIPSPLRLRLYKLRQAKRHRVRLNRQLLRLPCFRNMRAYG